VYGWQDCLPPQLLALMFYLNDGDVPIRNEVGVAKSTLKRKEQFVDEIPPMFPIRVVRCAVLDVQFHIYLRLCIRQASVAGNQVMGLNDIIGPRASITTHRISSFAINNIFIAPRALREVLS